MSDPQRASIARIMLPLIEAIRKVLPLDAELSAALESSSPMPTDRQYELVSRVAARALGIMAASRTRRFYLERLEDVSGASGTGIVAEGIVFTDGTCALRWMTALRSTCIYDSITAVEKIHGHEGKTLVVYPDGIR